MSSPGRPPRTPLGPVGGSPGLLPHLVMLCAVFTFSSGLIVNKSLVLRISPGEVFAGQLVIGTVVLWAYLLLRKGWPELGADWWKMLLMGVMAPGLVNVTNILGMQRTSAVNVVIIWALMPLLVQLLGRVFLREPLRASLIAGCIIAFCGVLLIIGTRHGGAGDLLGDLLVIGAVLCSCVTQLLGRRVNQRADSLVVATVQVSAATVIALAVFPLLGDDDPLFNGWSAPVLAELAYLGVVSTFFLFLFYNTALRHLPVGRVGLFMTLIPAIGTVGAATYLNEPVAATDMAGLAVVMGGVALPFVLSLMRRPQPRARQEGSG